MLSSIPKKYVTTTSCSSVTLCPKLISLNNMFFSFCINPCHYNPMLVCYSVSKTYVIEKICLFVIPSKIYVTLSSKPMFFCLTQKPHPVRRPPLCRRGAGGEAVPQERENQINTLVLKDINFTINIIELSYYRTIDTLNQS